MTPPNPPTDNGASPMPEGEGEIISSLVDSAEQDELKNYVTRKALYRRLIEAGLREGRRLERSRLAELVGFEEELKAQEEAHQAERSNWIMLQEEYAHLRQKLAYAEKEAQEQARLNGIGSEREAALSTKLDLANKTVFMLAEEYENLRKFANDYEEQRDRYKVALEKIADPRKRDHKEPDAYTELGCVMNIANEALSTKAEPHGEAGKE
jgi:hypothetical protein